MLSRRLNTISIHMNLGYRHKDYKWQVVWLAKILKHCETSRRFVDSSTVDTVHHRHWTWSVVAALVAAVVTNKHSDGEKYSRRLLMTELEDTIVMSIGHVGFYNSSITSTTVTCTTVIRWSMVVGLFKDISNNWYFSLGVKINGSEQRTAPPWSMMIPTLGPRWQLSCAKLLPGLEFIIDCDRNS